MPEWMREPGVVTGLLALVGVVLTPFVNARIKRKENGRIAAAAAAQVAESQRVEASERRLRELLDRQADEITRQTGEITDLYRQLREQRAETEALDDKVKELERQAYRNARKLDGSLAGMFGIANEIHGGIIEGDSPDLTLGRVRKMMDSIETLRGGIFNGHHKESA